jgi:hypothetical protein
MVLNPTNVGRSFFSLAHIKVNDVNSVKKYSHHNYLPNSQPGTIIQALAVQDRNSTVL